MMKLTATLLLLLCLIPLAYAHEDKPRTAAGATTAEERETLSRLHVANQKEIKAGALAVERGQSKETRRFGRHLVDDHTAADGKLVALAKRKSVELPEMESSALDVLRNAKDADFDRIFSSMMVKEHEQAIKLVKGAQGTCKDTEILAFLKDVLPTLEKHRDMAADLQNPIRAEAPVQKR
jgi:putative membrane protein